MSRNRVPMVPAMSWFEIGKMADRFVRRTHPELLVKPGPFPVRDFIEFHLGTVEFSWAVEELPHGKEAHTDFEAKTIILSVETYNALCEDDRRARFTVMHEIGHAEIHDPYLSGILSDGRETLRLRRSEIRAYRDPECQANAFAAAVLMPTRHIKQMVDVGLGVREIYETFRVSWAAACHRISGLDRFLRGRTSP